MPGEESGKQPKGPPPPPPADSVTQALKDLNQQMATLFTRMEALESRPAAATTAASTLAAATNLSAAASLPLPLHQIQFPRSPSPLPTGPQLPMRPVFPSGPEVGSGGAGTGLGAPRFHKLDFPTYDGAEDPLNWLNRCEQFFRGQRTMASDRVWLASYHLTGAARTWYYALEQDEGVPSWERFKELCHLRFGPPIRANRLAELARLPFLSTVQDYQERFNALLCHAPQLPPL